MILQLPLFQQALPLIKKINKHGHEAYFVGGSVRDALLHKPISDIDIATSATPDEIKHIFPATVDVGIEHGTVLVIEQGVGYEITTFRTEGAYLDFRRPSSVAFVRNLKEDLQRRDFTINALALSAQGEIIDYFEGKKDLKNGLIRAVGVAQERFGEDALRMLRAIRFVGQLDFELEQTTQHAIHELAGNLTKIAIERIRVEWVKILTSPARKRALNLLMATQLNEYIPAFNIRSVLQSLADNPIQHLTELQAWMLLVFYTNTNATVKQLLSKWKCSNQTMKDVQLAFTLLQRRLTQEWNYKMAFDCPFNIAQQVEEIVSSVGGAANRSAFINTYETLPIQSLQDIALDGTQIMTILQLERPGPVIGQVLEQLKEAILTKQLENEPVNLKRYIREQFL